MRAQLAWIVEAAVLLAISPSSADVPATGVVTLQITSLRSNNGQIGCMIYNSAKGFPKDSSTALRRRWCPIASAASTCTVNSTESRGRFRPWDHQHHGARINMVGQAGTLQCCIQHRRTTRCSLDRTQEPRRLRG